MKLIIGLGNPEQQYSGTRHNLGFALLDEYLRRHHDISQINNIWTSEKKFKSQVAKLGDLIFVKPETFMNKSGLAVSLLANYYKIEPEDIIIIHDELDVPLGHIKMRLGGAAAGHHGVESVIEALGTDQFIRIRLGIGTLKALTGERKISSFNAEHFVLDPFTPKETTVIKHLLKKATKALDTLLEKGLEKAQNQFN